MVAQTSLPWPSLCFPPLSSPSSFASSSVLFKANPATVPSDTPCLVQYTELEGKVQGKEQRLEKGCEFLSMSLFVSVIMILKFYEIVLIIRFFFYALSTFQGKAVSSPNSTVALH